MRGEPPETCNREEGEPAAARWGVDEISHQPLTQWERGDVQEGLRAEPWISPSIVWDQDGGFGGHFTGERVGTSEREATKDLCMLERLGTFYTFL